VENIYIDLDYLRPDMICNENSNQGASFDFKQTSGKNLRTLITRMICKASFTSKSKLKNQVSIHGS
jgi:hypothetical protein